MRLAVATVLVLVASAFVPMAAGYHLSVGNQDAAGVQPSETPDTPSVSDDLYDRGLETNCYEPDGSGSASDLQAAAAADAFCGRLAYHDGTDFQVDSPVDQDIPAGSGVDLEFDVVYASYVGNYGLSTCIPWCLPGGKPAFDAIHTVGNALGLTGPPGEAWAGDDSEGWEEYALNTLYPNALIMAQDATGAWQGDGWAHTVHDMQFVGFVTEADDTQLTQEELDTLVATLESDGTLDAAATPSVCGFSPDIRIVIDATQAGFCEVLFKWVEESESQPFGDDYADSCHSAVYMCGALTEAWYAQLVCKTFFFITSINPGSFGCAGDPLEDGPAWSANDYDIWHFVVAPTVSDCNGAQEPGFATTTGGSVPYLAHDLDIYTPAATAADLNNTEAIQNSVRKTLDDNVFSALNIDTSSFTSLVDSAIPTQVVKDDQVEPNANGDTSRSQHVIDRTLASDPCLEIVPSAETSATVDPWVDLVDNQVTFDAVGEAYGEGTDLYLTGDEDQDASNRPGPGMYYANGHVGVFTDKNDDGEYDGAGSDALFQDIYSVGAYPLFWDYWLDATTLQPNYQAGCGLGFTDKKLTEEMDLAGYGTHTGLIQVIYLGEPTVLFNWQTSDTVPYPDGDTAFVFLSQGLHALNDAGDQVVQDAIQDAIDKLPTTPGNIVYPAKDLGEQTDFFAQCSEGGTGDYTNIWGFVHATAAGGAGDTVVTEYLFEVASSDGQIGGSGIPVFSPNNQAYAFGTGLHQWFDVDPMDGVSSRNSNSAPPPSGD